MVEALDFATVSKRVRGDLAQRHRYAHCVRVARLASRLARIHGEDPHRAMLAGMLHDLARLYSAEKLLAESARCGVPVDEYANKNPIVLHAPLGAALARERFGVTDRAILSAIAKHTLAAAEMSPLDTIVFLADGLEPGRVFEARARLVRLAEQDLSAALRATLAAHMAHLHEQGIPPAPQTAEAADAFLARTTRRQPLAELLDVVREAALDKKAEDLIEIDIAGKTIIADTFVIATGRSKIQTRSIADAIVEKVKAGGFPVARTEGYGDGTWILLDLGPVVVHIFTPEQRLFYNLERLWANAADRQAQIS